MKLTLIPQRPIIDTKLTVEKAGEVLTINGEPFDFGLVPEGATIKAGDIPCEWICGDVERINGDLHIFLRLPIDANPAEYVSHPAPLVNPPDGVLDLPFSPYSETSEDVVEGGRNITTTRYEWRAEPVVTTEFVPDPPPKPVEPEAETAAPEPSPETLAAIEAMRQQTEEQANGMDA